MNQPISEELLSAYLDGELSPAERADVERSLEESPGLREHLEELAEICRAVRSLHCPCAPEDLRHDVLRAVSQRDARSPAPAVRKPLRRAWIWSGVGTALAACVAIVLISSPRRGPQLEHVGQIVAASTPTGNVDGAGHRSEQMADLRGAPAPGATLPRYMKKSENRVLGVLRENASEGDGLAPPVPVVGLTREEIRDKLIRLGRAPQVGNSISLFGSPAGGSDETPVVVEFTVVDVMESLNQMQVLLKQQTHASPGGFIQVDMPQSGKSQLTAMELELDEREMAAVLNSVPAVDAVLYVAQADAPQANEPLTNQSLRQAPLSAPAAPSAPSNADQRMAGRELQNAAAQPERAFNPSPAGQLPVPNAAEAIAERRAQKAERKGEVQQNFSFRQLTEPPLRDLGQEKAAGKESENALAEKRSQADRLREQSSELPAVSLSTQPAAAAVSGQRPEQQADSFIAAQARRDQAVADKASLEQARRIRAFVVFKQQVQAAPAPNKP